MQPTYVTAAGLMRPPDPVTDLNPERWRFPPGLSARLVTEAEATASTATASTATASALTPAEAERMAGFGHPSRRSQFLLGRVAARTLAGERLGVAARDVPLTVGADGAPELPRLGVSIAHTGRDGASAALAAVADRAVGVDLERIAARRPDLWRRILASSETHLLDQLGGPTDTVQTLLWTLKEAVLKAQRTGFRAGGTSVEVRLDPSQGVPEAGAPGWASATAQGVRWSLAFGRHADLWLAVAWRAR